MGYSRLLLHREATKDKKRHKPTLLVTQNAAGKFPRAREGAGQV